MSSPTFNLPPCPVCSGRLSLDRPLWKYAHATSAKRDRNCYFFVGCRHVAEVSDGRKIYDDPAEWSFVEDAWGALVERLFAHHTEGWTEVQRSGWARALADEATLSEDSPPEKTTNEPTKKHETR